MSPLLHCVIVVSTVVLILLSPTEQLLQNDYEIAKQQDRKILVHQQKTHSNNFGTGGRKQEAKKYFHVCLEICLQGERSRRQALTHAGKADARLNLTLVTTEGRHRNTQGNHEASTTLPRSPS